MTEKKNLDKSKIKILVCCHKPCELPQDDIFLPIHCGKALSNLDLGIQGDNEVNGMPCDNISEKNDTYCELTAMYWAWKNIKKLYPDIEYIGLNHYRRYFYFKKLFFNPVHHANILDISSYKIPNLCKTSKIIIPKKWTFSTSVYNQYNLCHYRSDLDTCMTALEQVINPHIIQKFVTKNKLSPCNMFIMPWDLFDQYCSFLFPFLSKLECKIPVHTYDSHQKRVIGFLAERIFNVYVEAFFSSKEIKFFPLIMFDNKKDDSIINNFFNIIYKNCIFLTNKIKAYYFSHTSTSYSRM